MKTDVRTVHMRSIILGVILGILVSVLLIYLFIDIRANQIAKQVWVNPTPTQSSSEEEIYNLLAEADQNLQYGNPHVAIDLIEPVIETWSSPIDRATGYQLLSVAEGRLSHEKKLLSMRKKWWKMGQDHLLIKCWEQHTRLREIWKKHWMRIQGQRLLMMMISVMILNM